VLSVRELFGNLPTLVEHTTLLKKNIYEIDILS
jgi:hypothetical protein